MLVELKNGETFNGTLTNCDQFMNMNLEDVTCTSRDGTRFWKMDKVYIRGYTLKYIRILDEIINKVKEEQKKSRSKPQQQGNSNNNSNTNNSNTSSQRSRSNSSGRGSGMRGTNDNRSSSGRGKISFSFLY
ncbi:predicted protein [Naegleria gruberi]|uniref:U6 snRNA-associated Sm-like protein LSm4 n=1 Tax=Naegleria gruberi TaxID=5762 RepID=D2VM49_NAEGR|nr:uncharacterized protein NAEGRDRAFT_70010 [Naegleria gruberi]EFC42257.1 predicted protein [Naegleria gruberi]|eukprot:XP_002675001.1 predicted protein [Naegleria gruberi strain NEG-M]